MYWDQRLQIVVHKSLVAANIARNSQIVEGHEDAVCADKGKPEVNLAQSLVHHAAEHFREPEVRSAENAENGRNRHHQMEVSHHEVGGVKHDVNRGLCQEEAADPAADKHRDKTQ